MTGETARLEDVTPGTRLLGVLPDQPVSVVQTQWHGSNAVTLTYRDERGRVGETLLYRDDEARLQVESAGRAWSFDADGKLFRPIPRPPAGGSCLAAFVIAEHRIDSAILRWGNHALRTQSLGSRKFSELTFTAKPRSQVLAARSPLDGVTAQRASSG